MPKMIGAAADMWCIQAMAPIAMTKAETEPTIGHGLGIDQVVVVMLRLRRHCSLSVSAVPSARIVSIKSG